MRSVTKKLVKTEIRPIRSFKFYGTLARFDLNIAPTGSKLQPVTSPVQASDQFIFARSPFFDVHRDAFGSNFSARGRGIEKHSGSIGQPSCHIPPAGAEVGVIAQRRGENVA